ncbi:MAG: glycosyltransferase family 2 protein, partial [Bdellovibrionota bacterium]
MKNSLAILIPVFNESKRLESFLGRLETIVRSLEVPTHLVIVDDGSEIPLRLEGFRIHLLRHCLNLGQGAALQTALSYARDQLDCAWFVTMDSDGQHDPKELEALLTPIREDKADIAFGNRFANGTPTGIPIGRRVILGLAAVFELLITG